MTPSPDDPFPGGCLCGGVRFEVVEPFLSASYCHCTHCQRRTGTAASAQARAPRTGLRLLSGADLLRSFTPAEGIAKIFCSHCGSSLFSGDLDAGEVVGIRLGAFDRDPGIRPQWRQWVESAAVGEPIPHDRLPRFPGRRPPQ
jgi:hypothetical protein